MNTDDQADLEPYGEQPETPDPDVIPSGRVWAYAAIIGGLLCWPVGIGAVSGADSATARGGWR